jgi:hypothetical protein
MNELIENLSKFLNSTNNLNVIIQKLKQSSRGRLESIESSINSNDEVKQTTLEYWIIQLLLDEFQKLFEEIKRLNHTDAAAQIYYDITELDKIIDKYSRLIEFQTTELEKANNSSTLPNSILYLFTDFEGKIEADIKTEAQLHDFLTIAEENFERWQRNLKDAEVRKEKLERELQDNFKKVENFKQKMLEELRENRSRIESSLEEVFEKSITTSDRKKVSKRIKDIPQQFSFDMLLNSPQESIINHITSNKN